ncbi:MAG: DUF2520 domain-containing protein [Cyclobacteriaceae bacterium]|nr:DUF2520 domain-containing protein [Cyclobacteriaceae bacterium]
MERFDVSVIGSGNVAWHLAPALDNGGFKVREVYSRSAAHAKEITGRLYEAVVKTDLDFSDTRSRLIIIAVADEAIEEIATELVVPDNVMVVHTSGSQPMSLLGYLPTDHIGVFYPLQTFSKGVKVDFDNVPFFIESQTREGLEWLNFMGETISNRVIKADSADRKALHVAAVFASNFLNHMLTLSQDILDRKGLDFDLLQPLVTETVNKALNEGPANVQTGPAIRKDRDIIEQHTQYLAYDERLMEIYRLISENIMN